MCNPKGTRKALAILAEGGSIGRAVRGSGLAPQTVRRLLAENKDDLKPVKDALAKEALAIATEGMEQTRKALPEASARDAAWVAGVMVDKYAVLANDLPTERQEVQHQGSQGHPTLPAEQVAQAASLGAAGAIAMLLRTGALQAATKDPVAEAKPVIETEAKPVA